MSVRRRGARWLGIAALLTLAAAESVPEADDGVDQITRAAIASMRRRGGNDE